MINKKVNNIKEGIFGLKSQMTIMFGGFGLSGIPENAIQAISKENIFVIRILLIRLFQATKIQEMQRMKIFQKVKNVEVYLRAF